MATPPRILGLHHVTAIASDAQKNVDFYTGVLGLKLVKVNVNQDDPTSLHLYYGDDQASPGSLVTFFVYPGIERGVVGHPQVTSIRSQRPEPEDTLLEDRLRQADLDLIWNDQSDSAFPHDSDGLGVGVEMAEPDRPRTALTYADMFVREPAPTITSLENGSGQESSEKGELATASAPTC